MDAFFLQNPLLLVFIALWTLPWKGVALWRAARLGDTWWFVALLIFQTLAVLEILYIFIFSKRAGIQKISEHSGA